MIPVVIPDIEPINKDVNITSIIERDTELYINEDVILTLVYTTQEAPSKGKQKRAVVIFLMCQ